MDIDIEFEKYKQNYEALITMGDLREYMIQEFVVRVFLQNVLVDLDVIPTHIKIPKIKSTFVNIINFLFLNINRKAAININIIPITHGTVTDGKKYGTIRHTDTYSIISGMPAHISRIAGISLFFIDASPRYY